jgi:acyl transferase domain-containing protein
MHFFGGKRCIPVHCLECTAGCKRCTAVHCFGFRRPFRRLFLDKLAAAHAVGRLNFFGDHAALAAAQAFAAYVAPLRKTERNYALDKLDQEAHRTAVAQPALFAVEYALTKLWMEFGIEPKGMIGHSIGEYVAACLAGVFSLEDALDLVAARGRLMDEMPAGSMLAAPLSESEAQPFLDAEIAMAAVNAPGFCVFSGPTAAIDRLGTHLSARGVQARRLHTSHAFHSSMMDPVVPALVERVQRTARKLPQIPYLSNLTGAWMTTEATVDAAYWGRHLRETVRFADGLAEVMKYPEIILLEVGPGQTLSTLARQQPSTAGVPHVILTSLRAPQETQSDEAFLLNTMGTAMLNGAPVNWPGFYSREKRRRVLLPTYPFQRQRYWVGPLEELTAASDSAARQPRDVTNWFYTPKWEQRPRQLPPMAAIQSAG